MGGGGNLQAIFWIGFGGEGEGKKNIFVTETLVKSAKKNGDHRLFKKLAFRGNWFKNCATTAIVNLQPIF